MSKGVPAFQRKAIVLLSGGLDSSTALAIAISEGFQVHALSFRYGQRHSSELKSATLIARSMGVSQHTFVEIDLRAFGGSALTADFEVPKDREEGAMGSGIPITYVPARNTIMLAFALAQAEVVAAEAIYIGVSAIDYSGYPDCRPEFIAAFQQMANLATARAVGGQGTTIVAPLQNLSKAETIRIGTKLGVDYAITTSCYDPDENGYACGRCDSCQLRKKGFLEANVPDPTTYVEFAKL